MAELNQNLGTEWFNIPQGSDLPKDLAKEAGISRRCRVTFYPSDCPAFVSCKARIILESQQPKIIISVTNKGRGANGGHLVFGFKNSELIMGIEREGTDGWGTIQDAKKQSPHLFTGWDKVSFIGIKRNKPAIQVGAPWKLEGDLRQEWDTLCNNSCQGQVIILFFEWKENYTIIERAHSWIRLLQTMVTPPGNSSNGQTSQPRPFWHYENNELVTADNNKVGRRPEMPWLWTDPIGSPSRSYMALNPRGPYFCDDSERRWRLIEPTLIEADFQCQLITTIFCPARQHEAIFQRVPHTKDYFVHVKVLDEYGRFQLAVPEIAEATTVEFCLWEKGEEVMDPALVSLNLSGRVVDMDTTADFVMMVRYFPYNFPNGERRRIITKIEPNLHPVLQQAEALGAVTLTKVYGDMPESHKKGYSLHRTVLAQGIELDPENTGLYFEMNITEMTSVPVEEAQKRLHYILQQYSLDRTQREAFDRSTSKVCAGVHLIQGPPGTGKTHTAVAIILAYAALNLRVLLAAGSNKGVDNLVVAVKKALDRDARLAAWCGQMVRFRTPAYNRAVLRANSATAAPYISRRETDEDGLHPCQMHTLITKLAEEEPERPMCREFNALLAKDRAEPLSKNDNKLLKACIEDMMGRVFAKSKIVASTLNNTSQEILRLSFFTPEILVCDESGQCFEGDHM